MATLIAFNKFDETQQAALEGLLGEKVTVETRGGFFPAREEKSTVDFALAAADGVPAGTLVRNSGSYWGAAAIAAAIRGETGAWPRIVAFGGYPFPVYRVEDTQRLREQGRERRSNNGNRPGRAVVVNLGHPLTDDQLNQIKELTGSPDFLIVGVKGDTKFHMDLEKPLSPQVAQFIDEVVDLPGATWQGEQIFVNLPGHSEAAVLAAAYLEGLMGYVPPVFRVDGRKVGEKDGRNVMAYDITEVIQLQDLRIKAAELAAGRQASDLITIKRTDLEALVHFILNFEIELDLEEGYVDEHTADVAWRLRDLLEASE